MGGEAWEKKRNSGSSFHVDSIFKGLWQVMLTTGGKGKAISMIGKLSSSVVVNVPTQVPHDAPNGLLVYC